MPAQYHQLFADAQRQQAMADALQQGAMTPRQHQHGRIVANTGGADAVASLAQAMMSRRTQKKATATATQAEEERRQAQAAALAGMGGQDAQQDGSLGPPEPANPYARSQQAIEAGVDPALVTAYMQQQSPQKPTELSYGAKLIDPKTGEVVAENARDPSDTQTGVPGSLQELQAINSDRASRGEAPIKPEEYLSQRRGSSADSQLYAQYANAATERGEVPMPIEEFLVNFRGSVSGSQQGAEETQKRRATQIAEGLSAADAYPIAQRGLELLNEVKTGGINSVALKASNLFGVTGADEAELSANLGKAVLSQLRSTFGAQFTALEGERLQEIESGFGKSTEANKRLLEQAAKLVERVARRGIAAAKATGNDFDAEQIEAGLKFSLSPAAAEPAQPQEAPSNEVTATGPNGEKVVLRNGQWVPM